MRLLLDLWPGPVPTHHAEVALFDCGSVSVHVTTWVSCGRNGFSYIKRT